MKCIKQSKEITDLCGGPFLRDQGPFFLMKHLQGISKRRIARKVSQECLTHDK